MTRLKRARPFLLFTTMAAILAVFAIASRANTNGAGATLSFISSESDAFASQVNSLGVQLELAGVSQGSVDMANPAGARAYTGLLLPNIPDWLTIIREFLLGWRPLTPRDYEDADLNRDGHVDIADIILILQDD